MNTLDLTAITLDKGAHDDPDEGHCLLEKYGPKIANRLAGDGDCLVYTGHRDENGYGRMYVNGVNRRLVHRVVWEMANGPIPDGMVVCHRCDNPPCCYIDHLFLGTKGDNNTDRHQKGRTVLPTNGPDYWRSKTHCPAGHAYAGENVRFRKNGCRRCAECYRERSARYARENRDKINARRRALRAERSAR